jgi:hypothetical protein
MVPSNYEVREISTLDGSCGELPVRACMSCAANATGRIRPHSLRKRRKGVLGGFWCQGHQWRNGCSFRCIEGGVRLLLVFSTSMGGASVPSPATHLLLVLNCGHLDTAVRRPISTSPTPRRDVNAFWGVMCLTRTLLLCGEGVGFQCTAVSKTPDGFWLLASFGTGGLCVAFCATVGLCACRISCITKGTSMAERDYGSQDGELIMPPLPNDSGLRWFCDDHVTFLGVL